MLISLSGAALIITKGHPMAGMALAPGDLLALLAMLGWAGYTLLQNRVGSGLSFLARIGLFAAAGALFSLPFALHEIWSAPAAAFNQHAALVYLFAGLVPGLFAYSAYAYLGSAFGAVSTSLSLYLGPIVSAVLSIAFLGEAPTMIHLIGGALSLSVDDFIRTSRDPRHRPGVEAFWRACSGDLYRQQYTGLYCTGCEQFYRPAELRDGRCPEHGTEPEQVSEENWFFRLSRYAAPLREAITSGRLRIEPAGRRNEVLGLIDGGLADFSVSRPAGRAGGWGIPVPGDPGQVVYVWFDALCNYVTALGYGQDGLAGDGAYRRWWAGPGNRVHLLGKGVLRFHEIGRAHV